MFVSNSYVVTINPGPGLKFEVSWPGLWRFPVMGEHICVPGSRIGYRTYFVDYVSWSLEKNNYGVELGVSERDY